VRYCNLADIECSFRGHTISSLRLALNSPDNKWGVQLYARNLNDTRVPNGIIYPRWARALARALPTASARTRSAAWA
jgi:hypothetical protein